MPHQNRAHENIALVDLVEFAERPARCSAAAGKQRHDWPALWCMIRGAAAGKAGLDQHVSLRELTRRLAEERTILIAVTCSPARGGDDTIFLRLAR
jgi:hypothetical protein